MEKAFRYRIYPSKKQRQILSRIFGSVRFVYNFFLAMRKNEYAIGFNTVGYNQCCAQLTLLKKEKDYAWLSESDSSALQSSIRNLDNAFRNFFWGNGGYPHFHSKKSHYNSYTSKNNNHSIRIDGKTLRLPKVGNVRMKVSRPTDGRIISATISCLPSGHYYASVLCKCEEQEQFPESETAVGIDLGVHDLIILSDGRKIGNPKYLESSLRRLRHQQRILSRKSKGSHSYEKQRLRVAGLQEHIASQRRDFLQKLSTEIVRRYGIIGAESLDVKSMLQKDRALSGAQNRTFHRHTAQTGMGKFLRILRYKSEWYGRKLVQAEKYFASSQICSACGEKYPMTKDLTMRKWICPACGAHHDRDINAAVNLRQYALIH